MRDETKLPQKILANSLFFLTIILLLYLQIKTSFPTLPPQLNEKVPICDINKTSKWNTEIWGSPDLFQIGEDNNGRYLLLEYTKQPNNIYLECATNLAFDTLFRANNILIKISANQDMDLAVALNKDTLVDR
jgi:hypothetical protein